MRSATVFKLNSPGNLDDGLHYTIRWPSWPQKGSAVSGALEMTSDMLIAETPTVREGKNQAFAHPKADFRPEKEETSGLVIAAPSHLRRDELLGVLYGGILLNKNYTIVDKVRDTVFHNETYNNSNLGTPPSFSRLRISTNS